MYTPTSLVQTLYTCTSTCILYCRLPVHIASFPGLPVQTEIVHTHTLLGPIPHLHDVVHDDLLPYTCTVRLRCLWLPHFQLFGGKCHWEEYLRMVSLFISQRPSPVGSMVMAGPPAQNVQAGYIMS